jgi:hypothetical protein
MKQIAIKLAAYILIGSGVTIWCNMLNGFSCNADQVVGLTVCFALVGLIVHGIVATIQENRAPAPPTINVLDLFEEV